MGDESRRIEIKSERYEKAMRFEKGFDSLVMNIVSSTKFIICECLVVNLHCVECVCGMIPSNSPSNSRS